MNWKNQFLNAASSQKQYQEKAESERRYYETFLEEFCPRISSVCTEFARITGWKFRDEGRGEFYLMGEKMAIHISLSVFPEILRNQNRIYVHSGLSHPYDIKATILMESFTEENLAKVLVDIAEDYHYGY